MADMADKTGSRGILQGRGLTGLTGLAGLTGLIGLTRLTGLTGLTRLRGLTGLTNNCLYMANLKLSPHWPTGPPTE